MLQLSVEWKGDSQRLHRGSLGREGFLGSTLGDGKAISKEKVRKRALQASQLFHVAFDLNSVPLIKLSCESFDARTKRDSFVDEPFGIKKRKMWKRSFPVRR
jgi:hypothetical protein